MIEILLITIVRDYTLSEYRSKSWSFRTVSMNHTLLFSIPSNQITDRNKKGLSDSNIKTSGP